MAANRKWDCSAVVYLSDGTVRAEDSFGAVIAEGPAGSADAAVLQAAIDSVHPAGEVRLCRGHYLFDKPVVLYNSCTLRGEGRGTVIAPPSGEYAFKVTTTDATTIYRPFHGDPGPLYAVIVRDLTIDGQRSDAKPKGKGIYMEYFWCSSFENLWIQNTGTALYLYHTKESDFTNIYLIGNGDADACEASVIMIGENNNIHFRGLDLIYPNYVGLDMVGTRDEGIEVPRLTFISQSMFHGFLRQEGPAPYDMIRIRDLDATREGCLADVVIRDSRITTPGVGQTAVNISNSPVTIDSSIITASSGECAIRVTDAARVRITGNTFHGGSPTCGQYALYVEDAEVIFKNNILNGKNLNIALAPAVNSIVADNRFIVDTDRPTIWVGDNGSVGSARVDIHGNIFTEKRAPSAITVSPLASDNIHIRDNQFAGTYGGKPVS